MVRAPSARIQARRERAAKVNEDVVGQAAQPNQARQANQRNASAAPARARRRRAEEEEVEQDPAYDEGANYDGDVQDEDYVAEEEEEESEEVELEPEDEEQEPREPLINDLVAVMANQTHLLEALVRNQQGPRGNARGQEARLSEFIKFKPTPKPSTSRTLFAPR